MIVHAQDTTLGIPSEPTVTSTSQTDAAETAFDAAVRAEAAAVLAQEAADRATETTDVSMRIVNIFETTGLLFSVFLGISAVIVTVLGFVWFNGLRNRLNNAEQLAPEFKSLQNRFGEITQAQKDVTSMREDVERERGELRTLERKLGATIEENRTQVRQELRKYGRKISHRMKIYESKIQSQRDEINNAILALGLMPLGERQYRIKDNEGALDTYKRALKLDQENPIILYKIAYVHAQMGELETAEKCLTQARTIVHDFAPAIATLGFVYRRMAEKMPEHNDHDVQRSKLLADAESLLIQALTMSPSLIDEDGESWWGSLGGLYKRRKEDDKAIDAYEKAAKVVPYSSYPLSNIAPYYLKRRDKEKMLSTYRRVERIARGKIQASPDEYWPYADLLVARLAIGKIQEAEETLQSVLEMLPEDLPYAASSLIDTLEKISGLLDESAHIQTAIDKIRQHLSKSTPAANGKTQLTDEATQIVFEKEQSTAVVAHVTVEDDVDAVAKRLGIDLPKAAIFVLGGAVHMKSPETDYFLRFVEDGLATFAEQHQLAIIDGGTATGINKLLGDIRTKRNFTFPLIGVAPVNLVRYPGNKNITGYEIDAGHSHFVFSPEGDFGDETDTIVQLAYALASDVHTPVLGIIVNGGKIVKQEVFRIATGSLRSVPLLVISGTGRFADELAHALSKNGADMGDEALNTIKGYDNAQVISINDGVEVLHKTLKRYFPQQTQG
jgi:tetratricopeptide (TPR) repeat protein